MSAVNYAECCQHYGEPLTKGGNAIACGPGGGLIPLPDYCANPQCRTDREEAAIAKAIADGVIDP